MAKGTVYKKGKWVNKSSPENTEGDPPFGTLQVGKDKQFWIFAEQDIGEKQVRDIVNAQKKVDGLNMQNIQNQIDSVSTQNKTRYMSNKVKYPNFKRDIVKGTDVETALSAQYVVARAGNPLVNPLGAGNQEEIHSIGRINDGKAEGRTEGMDYHVNGGIDNKYEEAAKVIRKKFGDKELDYKVDEKINVEKDTTDRQRRSIKVDPAKSTSETSKRYQQLRENIFDDDSPDMKVLEAEHPEFKEWVRERINDKFRIELPANSDYADARGMKSLGKNPKKWTKYERWCYLMTAMSIRAIAIDTPSTIHDWRDSYSISTYVSDRKGDDSMLDQYNESEKNLLRYDVANVAQDSFRWRPKPTKDDIKLLKEVSDTLNEEEKKRGERLAKLKGKTYVKKGSWVRVWQGVDKGYEVEREVEVMFDKDYLQNNRALELQTDGMSKKWTGREESLHPEELYERYKDAIATKLKVIDGEEQLPDDKGVFVEPGMISLMALQLMAEKHGLTPFHIPNNAGVIPYGARQTASSHSPEFGIDELRGIPVLSGAATAYGLGDARTGERWVESKLSKPDNTDLTKMTLSNSAEQDVYTFSQYAFVEKEPFLREDDGDYYGSGKYSFKEHKDWKTDKPPEDMTVKDVVDLNDAKGVYRPMGMLVPRVELEGLKESRQGNEEDIWSSGNPSIDVMQFRFKTPLSESEKKEYSERDVYNPEGVVDDDDDESKDFIGPQIKDAEYKRLPQPMIEGGQYNENAKFWKNNDAPKGMLYIKKSGDKTKYFDMATGKELEAALPKKGEWYNTGWQNIGYYGRGNNNVGDKFAPVEFQLKTSHKERYSEKEYDNYDEIMKTWSRSDRNTLIDVKPIGVPHVFERGAYVTGTGNTRENRYSDKTTMSDEAKSMGAREIKPYGKLIKEGTPEMKKRYEMAGQKADEVKIIHAKVPVFERNWSTYNTHEKWIKKQERYNEVLGTKRVSEATSETVVGKKKKTTKSPVTMGDNIDVAWMKKKALDMEIAKSAGTFESQKHMIRPIPQEMAFLNMERNQKDEKEVGAIMKDAQSQGYSPESGMRLPKSKSLKDFGSSGDPYSKWFRDGFVHKRTTDDEAGKILSVVSPYTQSINNSLRVADGKYSTEGDHELFRQGEGGAGERRYGEGEGWVSLEGLTRNEQLFRNKAMFAGNRVGHYQSGIFEQLDWNQPPHDGERAIYKITKSGNVPEVLFAKKTANTPDIRIVLTKNKSPLLVKKKIGREMMFVNNTKDGQIVWTPTDTFADDEWKKYTPNKEAAEKDGGKYGRYSSKSYGSEYGASSSKASTSPKDALKDWGAYLDENDKIFTEYEVNIEDAVLGSGGYKTNKGNNIKKYLQSIPAEEKKQKVQKAKKMKQKALADSAIEFKLKVIKGSEKKKKVEKPDVKKKKIIKSKLF